MDAIRSLISSVVALVLLFSAVELILPEGSTRGYARFVCGLLLLTSLLRPLVLLLDVNSVTSGLGT